MKRDLYGIEMAGIFAMAIVWYSLYIMIWFLGKGLVDRVDGSVVTFGPSIFLMVAGSGSLVFSVQVDDQLSTD